MTTFTLLLPEYAQGTKPVRVLFSFGYQESFIETYILDAHNVNNVELEVRCKVSLVAKSRRW